jgi:nucleotide-binding universal stress UspA family protein
VTASQPSGVRRIVVGYDGSEPSARAARFALGLVTTPPMELWFVHATHGPSAAAEPRTDEERGTETAAIEHGLRSLQASAAPDRHRVELWLRDGAPADVLLAAAEEVGADLIVVGTRGLRGAGRVLLGSVSAAVLARSRWPVVVVP